ncbi:MAG: S16 family serine protease, partial [Bacteroidia bacterium]
KEVILCADNRKDVEDIKAEYLKGMNFNYVTEMKEVLEFALLKEKVKNAIEVTV